VDTLSPARRSENMRNIRSANTRPEVSVRSMLHRMGYRFRLHVKNLPGKPDIVLPRHGKIVLVHGCFWHQHSQCGEGRMPASRQQYWLPKLTRNIERDLEHKKALRKLGWNVLVIWECELRHLRRVEAKLARFIAKDRQA
jgi:DNA mismatch endonuclease, patch repair protein